jgi:pyrroloquinoline quinone (PQQ) biosynthesis protein C
MDLFARIDAVRARRDVLATATERAAQDVPALAPHAREEVEHVVLWDGFVDEVGGDAAAAPVPETARCAAVWAGSPEDSLLEHLVGIYAIEASQPAISAVKADGLRSLYGVDDPVATAYFDLHAERDVDHAREGRELIERLLDGADEDALVARADAVLAANWELLDGVERSRPS